jgi:hypothetical protein
MNVQELSNLQMPMRRLTSAENNRIEELVEQPVADLWDALESSPGGKLLLEMLCRTEMTVDASLLVFISDSVTSREEAAAWVYLLSFRRVTSHQEVDWESFRASLPQPDMWPEESEVRARSKLGIEAPELWVGLASL